MFCRVDERVKLNVTALDIEQYKKRNRRKIKQFRKKCRFVDKEFEKLITKRKDEIKIPLQKWPILENQHYIFTKIKLWQFIYGINFLVGIDGIKKCLIVKVEG